MPAELQVPLARGGFDDLFVAGPPLLCQRCPGGLAGNLLPPDAAVVTRVSRKWGLAPSMTGMAVVIRVADGACPLFRAVALGPRGQAAARSLHRLQVRQIAIAKVARILPAPRWHRCPQPRPTGSGRRKYR